MGAGGRGFGHLPATRPVHTLASAAHSCPQPRSAEPKPRRLTVPLLPRALQAHCEIHASHFRPPFSLPPPLLPGAAQVLLVQIAVPSRTDVPEYQKLRR